MTLSSDSPHAELRLDRRRGLPDEIAPLRDRYPRPAWPRHDNYGQLAAFWQQVHQSLRVEGRNLAGLTAEFRGGDMAPGLFQRRFMSELGHHLQHLEGHHHIEDAHYFPRFRALDRRFQAGFDLLENDHDIIHEQLMQVADSAKALMQALTRAHSAGQRAAERYADDAERLLAFLDRHLDDEEDLVIPAMLEYGERPLQAGG